MFLFMMVHYYDNKHLSPIMEQSFYIKGNINKH
jgi:hypothetical protein